MKPNHILLIIAGVIILLFTLAGGCAGYHMGKNTCAEIVKSDTVRIVLHDSVLVKEGVKSQPKKVVKAKIASANIDTIHCDTLRLITRELIALADTCYYSDTLRNDTSYSIVVNDTVVGNRIGLGVEFKNLRPLVREVITNTVVRKQWTMFAVVQIPTNGKTVSVIPTVEITTPFGLCFGYGFEPINNRHVPNIGYAVKFGKK
jgi:hypothetical protein